MPGDLQPPPFEFPLRADRWPVHDADAGLAFPKGGMHGAFHAGVVHAFVLSGYYPEQLGASSMGVYAAVALATAADLDDQALRLELVSDLIEVWEANPGRAIFGRVWGGGPLRELIDELAGVRVSIGTLGDAAWTLWQGKPVEQVGAALRLWWSLPWTRRGVLARARLPVAAGKGILRSRRGGPEEAGLLVAQSLLDVYGMRDSLLGSNPGDEGFYDLFQRWLPEGEGNPRGLGDFVHSSLTIQLTNLRVSSELSTRRAELSRSPNQILRDGDGARLVATMRAATSLQPMHPAVRAGEVFGDRLPEGVLADDPLVDSSYIAYLPVGRMVEAWKEQGAAARSRPKRLFAVYSDPLDGAPPQDEGFFASGTHDLYLLRQRDLLHDLTVTRLITELLRASPGLSDELLIVDPVAIAPERSLGFTQVSVPSDGDLESAIHSGCRSALETLHGQTLTELGQGSDTVACASLLAALRERSTAPDGYFRPVSSACEGCPGQLRVPERTQDAERGPLRPSDRLERLVAEPGGEPAEGVVPLVLVPAGGAFLGVFHIGALVALRDHGVWPDIYAGASVGTMFSMLLHAGLEREDSVDPRLIDRMLDVDQWVDRDDTPPPGEPVGRVDRLKALVEGRLRLPSVRPLLDLSPRELLELLSQPSEVDPDAHALVCDAVAALLFPGATGPTGAVTPPVEGDAARRLVQELVDAVVGFDLASMLGFGDLVARHAGLVEEGREHDGELIGFDETRRLIHRFAFDGGEVPRLDEVAGERAHFLFTVTNHTTGRKELFGGPPDPRASFGPGESPEAIQAILAGSSLPLAFRRRSRSEVFGTGGPAEGESVYSDGGIFNNFPVDAALKYLRFLSGFPEYSWLGSRKVRFLLLPLDFPAPPPLSPPAGPLGCLRAASLSWQRGEHEKLIQIMTQQALVHDIALRANGSLRDAGEGGRPRGPQAILTDFDLISPARRVYPGSWSFKRWLGYTRDSQLELLSGGCRRARYTLRYREWRAGREEQGRPVSLEGFDAEVRAEQKDWKDREGEHCVMGRFNPGRCGFLDIDSATGAQVRRACVSTCMEDMPPEELPATSRADLWERVLKR